MKNFFFQIEQIFVTIFSICKMKNEKINFNLNNNGNFQILTKK